MVHHAMNETNVTDRYVYRQDDRCNEYDMTVPTMKMLLEDPPPEYFPMLGVVLFCLAVTTIIWVLELRKHKEYLRGKTFRLASRTCMLISCFWVFSFTSSLACLSLKSSVFLQYISNTFEAFCLLFFFDMMVIHLETEGFLQGKETMEMKAPPFCCCCPFPPMKSTMRNIDRLRYVIFQLIIFQTLVEMMCVLLVNECMYEPDNIRAIIGALLVAVSFLWALWAIFIVFNAGKDKANLRKHNYVMKFVGFKVVIIVNKIVRIILTKILGMGMVERYADTGPKSRVTLWCNVMTVVSAILMLLLTKNLYNDQDYEPLMKKVIYENKAAKEEIDRV